MRIRSVTAHAFGPLREETLEFADGMTVIVGDNESAKSSWHAAIFAGLCGRRRGKGKPRTDEQRFAELHKPWDHDNWLVTAQIALDDGRRIELRNDLAGKVDCHAKDLDLGRDISAEVMHDGAPDGSRWLGLDRSSFVATACVEQAQMLRVRNDADGLQEHLQRAAATAGTAATAAAALERIDEFFRDRVGLDRSNSTKPLRRALGARERTQRELEERRNAHDEYLFRVEQVEMLRDKATVAVAMVRAYEAAAAAVSADKWAQRVRRAGELHAVYRATAPPSVLDDDALVRRVSDALTAWRSRPAAPMSPERVSAQVQEEIAALPVAPDGDIEPHPSVLSAIDRVRRAAAQLELHGGSLPAGDIVVPQVAAGDDELLDLARTLDTPVPSVPPALVARESAARDAAAGAQGRGRSSTVLLAAGVAAVIVGVLLLAVTGPAVGASVALVGAGLLVAGVLRRRGDDAVSVARELAEAQTLLQAAQTQTAEVARRQEQASARCAQLGIAAHPAGLRAVPVARAHAAAHRNDMKDRIEQHAVLQGESVAAAAELAGALAARAQTQHGSDDAVLADAADYQQACRGRAAQAAAAARHDDLLLQLSSTQAAERRAADDERDRARAADLVLAAAHGCGITVDTPEDAVAALQSWVEQRTGRLGELSMGQQEWAELQALLEGGSFAELEESGEAARVRADRLVASVDPVLLTSVDAASAAEELSALRQAASQAETGAATAEGELGLFAGSIGSVAEAEEACVEATAERDRVLELHETLQLTRTFLEGAQTRVHRDIAPVLAEAVKQRLSAVTDERYTDVIVDPTSLQVQVCGPSRRWRKADLLSYGTAEQVYLLLRIALADHLTKGYDTCPLLLDDVTVHADAARTRDILDLLLQVAADRQVVVFTQEEQVATWARDNLTDPRHAIRELMPVAVS